MITNKKPLLYFIFDFRIFVFIIVREFFIIVRKLFFIIVRKLFLQIFFIYLQGKFFFLQKCPRSLHVFIEIFKENFLLQKCPRLLHVNKINFFYIFKIFFIDIRHVYLFSFQPFTMGKNLKIHVNCSNFSFLKNCVLDRFKTYYFHT